MTVKSTFKLGRINANEAEAKLVSIAIKNGEPFRKGEILLTLETTKVALDVVAPLDGKIISFGATEGAMLPIGSVVFEAEFEGDAIFEVLERVDDASQVEPTPYKTTVERRVSLRAEMLCKSLGIDPALISYAGDILKESDVRAHFDREGGLTLPPIYDVGEPSNFSSVVPPVSAARAIIVGAGGHAKAIIQLVREAGYSIAGVVAPDRARGSICLNGYPVLGADDDLNSILASGLAFAFVGVSGATENSRRATIIKKLKEAGFIMPPLVSRMASFDPTSHLGEATYVFPGATVGADCVIGTGVIINQGSIVCHDCRIGDYVHLAPGSILAGAVTVGSYSTIGMSATIMNNLTVGHNVLVHNTVAVAREIPAGKIATLNGIIEGK